MSAKSGSETRIRTHAFATRWSPAEYARLSDIADFAGCSRAEVLRQLVTRDHRNIIPSRELINSVRRLGNNINQLVRQRHVGAPVDADALAELYNGMLVTLIALRR